MVIMKRKWGVNNLNIGCDGERYLFVVIYIFFINKCVKFFLKRIILLLILFNVIIGLIFVF